MKEKEFDKAADWIRGNVNALYSRIDSSQEAEIGTADMLIESVLLLAKVINEKQTIKPSLVEYAKVVDSFAGPVGRSKL